MTTWLKWYVESESAGTVNFSNSGGIRWNPLESTGITGIQWIPESLIGIGGGV